MEERGPWDKYADQPSGSGERGPWDKFAGLPMYGPPAPPPGTGPDWNDIGKGAVGGVARGMTGLIGTGGTIGNLVRAGATWAGVPENLIAAGSLVAKANPFLNVLTGPSGSDVQHKVEEYTGKFYEPQTTAGKYASTVGEFAPAAVLPVGGAVNRAVAAGERVIPAIGRALPAATVNTVIPGAASETAGQLTEGSAAEPWARAGAGVMGGVLGVKALAPIGPATPARQRDIATLERSGVPVSAGERSGFKPLLWAESVAEDMPASSRAALANRLVQKEALDRVYTNQMFDPAQIAQRVAPGAALPRADVRAAGQQSLSDEYTRIVGQNPLRSNPQFLRDLYATKTEYERLVPPSERVGRVQNLYDDIVNKLVAGRGQIPGDEYQAIRKRLTENKNSGAAKSDPDLMHAYTGLRNALDNAFAAGLSPTDAAALRLNNQRWAIMKTLDPALAKAQSTGEHLSPVAVAQALRSGPRQSQYVQSAGAMDELAQAAARVLKPLPQSGTAPRTAYQNLFSIPTQMAAGAAAGAATFGLPGAIVGGTVPLLPHAAMRAIVSGPGQRYLSNQLPGQRHVAQNARDILAQALLEQLR